MKIQGPSRRVADFTTSVMLAACLAAAGTASAQNRVNLSGGARGMVKNGATGAPLEGMMVQLVSHKNAVRTTVYSNQEGRFEFPQLPAGWYVLRIARPLEFKPFQRDFIWVEGSTKLDDIILERVTDSEFLPPTAEILAQLTDAEWLFNLAGTGEEKKTFSNTCGSGCHTYQQSLRNRFDEKGWNLMLERMTKYSGRLLLALRTQADATGMPVAGGADAVELGDGLTLEGRDKIFKFLTRVRGPNSEFPAMKPFPRPRDAATRVVITEYELPHFDARPHDVVGDAEGNIWYTSNRNPIIGKLDPRTGVVKEYPVPITPGKHSGSHWMDFAKDGTIYFTETWSNNLGHLDPRSGEVHKLPGMGGNKGLAPDGFIWGTCGGGFICKFDPKTAKPVQKIAMKKSKDTYGNFVSPDGKFFAGGDPWNPKFDGIVFLDINSGEVWETETPSGHGDPSRGGFDPDGNAWVGGRGGTISEFVRKTHQVREFVSPTPYVTFYEARPDKNGEVWAGAQRGGRMVRYNPKTDRWIEYQFPEPMSLDWRTWVDNSTDPVTVWYGEHNGYLVRIQPLDGAEGARPVSEPAPAPSAASGTRPAPDPPQGNLQRSAEIINFKRLADSGPDRGKEIYFFKCWVCHNSYTRAAGSKAPPLKDLYKRPGLISGKPTNDETVSEQIRNGSANMPGYRYSLNDQDLNDLVSFLRSGKCCWEDYDEQHPPKNLHYKDAQAASGR